MSKPSEPLIAEFNRGVLLLTINRPQARNAVNLAVATALGNAIEQASHDNQVKVVVITGAGREAFCAGADLRAVQRGERLRPEDPAAEQWGFAGYTAHPISKPTIAAVNGAAVGGGLELVLASDLAVAADTAIFALPEVRYGIFPAAGGAFRLPEQLPRKVAMEMLLTGESVGANRAYALGLINKVVSCDELIPATLEMARLIAGLPPRAVQAAKRVAHGMSNGVVSRELEHWSHSEAEWALLHAPRA
jgi:crotonobetainyl-CoA hydratase